MSALVGKGSWFGGPGDSTDSGHTANGETTKTPGIAVYNHGTLGGYWRVTAPNGRSVVLKQTDIGPAPWTGRKIDVTYSALGSFGYGEHNFPTDSQFTATYLGKNGKGAATTPAFAPSSAPVARTTTPTAAPARQGPTRHERGLAQLASLIRSEDRSSPLPGLLESKLSTGSELGSKGTGSPLVSLPRLVSPSRSEGPQTPSAGVSPVGGPAAPNLHKVAPPVNVKLPGYITGKGFPAVEKGKAALERAEHHPVDVHELERAVTKSEHTGEVVATTKSGHPIVKTGGHTVYIPHPTRSKKGDQYHGG